MQLYFGGCNFIYVPIMTLYSTIWLPVLGKQGMATDSLPCNDLIVNITL